MATWSFTRCSGVSPQALDRRELGAMDLHEARAEIGEGLRIVIIGAGPTGLGAGHRLNELGHENWVLLESSDGAGGLARSFVDPAGFTWDVGGHVLFSGYPYFTRLIDGVLGADYSIISRNAQIWVENRLIPYPFQYNFGGLSTETVLDCILGAIDAKYRLRDAPPTDFQEWIHFTMGDGIGRHFMDPYNWKVWATPLKRMSFDWVADRVSPIDLEQLLRNVLQQRQSSEWGPNRSFKYPLRHGIGDLFDSLARPLDPHVRFRTPAVSIDASEQVVRTADGSDWPYDVLLSTVPLPRLVGTMISHVPSAIRGVVEHLEHTASHIVGFGVDRVSEKDATWIYFPDLGIPFHRVTQLSDYSPNMTPQAGQMSLLTETSWSSHKPEDPTTIARRVLEGLISTSLLTEADRDRVVSCWEHSAAITYPVPTVARDQALATIQPWLRDQQIWSRGRLGSWLYEIGNMDHCIMQGVEFVDNVLLGHPESVWSQAGGSSPR